MQSFIERIRRHAEHVSTAGQHCASEETTKQALILPLLDILGFSPFDPTRVKAEVCADFPGAKAGERVDYVLYCHNVPVMFIEAKAFGENLTNHAPQLSRYFNATPEVAIGAITNGREWRFFTDLAHKNVMDTEPFITIDYTNLDETILPRLYRFRHDEFQPDALRTLAEESIYLTAFKEVISASLRNPDAEFVRYVATRAHVQRQLNAKFIECITPLVKQAVEKSVADMVVSGLSSHPAPAAEPEIKTELTNDQAADVVDPNNARIVTTYAERRLAEIASEILGAEREVTPKDTESYYTLLFQGKTNRWLLRFWSERKIPAIQLCLEMNESRRRDVTRAGLTFSGTDIINLGAPENLMRLAPLIFEAYEHCRNDANFKRASSAVT